MSLIRIVLFIAITFAVLRAQETFLPVFQFNHISTGEGLPSVENKSAPVRDRQGLIWIGTWDGLARYDGYSCKVYRQDPRDPQSLSGNAINALYYDSKGRLWIGTFASGLSLYDPLHDHFVNFHPRKGDSSWIQSVTVFTICEDRSGNIWLRTNDEGLVRIEIPSQYQNELTSIDTLSKHIQFRHIAQNTRRGSINDISPVGNSSMLVASTQGLYCISPLKEKHCEILESKITGTILDTALVTTIFWQDSTTLWIGTRFDGLILLDLEKNAISEFHKRPIGNGEKRDDPIRDIQIDPEGRLWVITETELDLFDPMQKKYVEYLNEKGALKLSSVGGKLSVDSDGTLWISSGGNGIYFLTHKSTIFPNYGIANSDGTLKETETIKQWSDGSLWITSEGFIKQVDPVTFEVRKTIDMFKGKKSRAYIKGVTDSYNDGNGHLWYGSFGLGLFKFEPTTGVVTNYRASTQLPVQNGQSDWCRNISSGNGDTLYASGWSGGMVNFSMKTGRFKKVFYGYAGHVMQDNKGMVWIPDSRKNVFVYEPTTGSVRQFTHNVNDSGSLAQGRPMQTYQDPQGRIWISIGPVIDLWDPITRSFRHFRNIGAQDISSTDIIGSDGKGNLLISFSEEFLGILDPSTGGFRNYTTASGLGPFPNAVELLADGRIMLSNSFGFNIVIPESISTITSPPPFLITRMSINDRLNIPISTSNSRFPLQLTYAQNTIELEFAAIDPGSSNLIEYRYQLEGLEHEWVKTSSRRFVRYAGLNPGTYTFRVRANSIRNEWMPQEITLAIVIAPPWWNSGWFRVLSITSFLGIIGLLYRHEVIRHQRENILRQNFSQQLIEQQEEARKRLAYELHDSLGQNLLIVSNELQQFEKREEHQSEDLQRMIGMVQDSIDEIRTISSDLHPHHIERLGFCTAVEAMVDKLFHSSSIHIEFRCDPVNDLIPKEHTIHLYRIIQESLTNIIRHSSATTASLMIVNSKNAIEITIRDNGSGFEMNRSLSPISKFIASREYGRGFGITSMTERARITGAHLTITSEPKIGTTIRLILPLQLQ